MSEQLLSQHLTVLNYLFSLVLQQKVESNIMFNTNIGGFYERSLKGHCIIDIDQQRCMHNHIEKHGQTINIHFQSFVKLKTTFENRQTLLKIILNIC